MRYTMSIALNRHQTFGSDSAINGGAIQRRHVLIAQRPDDGEEGSDHRKRDYHHRRRVEPTTTGKIDHPTKRDFDPKIGGRQHREPFVSNFGWRLKKKVLVYRKPFSKTFQMWRTVSATWDVNAIGASLL